MLTQILAIARNTFLESVRQPIYFVLILAGGLVQAMNLIFSMYSMDYSDSSEVSSDDKMLLDIGLATVFIVATVLAALTATNVMSREIENKTALTVICKPVSRPVFVFGKYLGAVGAVGLATVALLLFFFLAIRHETVAAAWKDANLPVILFGGGAVLTALGIGIFGNFFYGWVFSSTAIFVMTPLLALAWGLTLVVGPDWAITPLTDTFKPQVMLASVGVLLALMVLTAVAVAASTRLGQVMTLVVCIGIFLAGMLSNFFLGRKAFHNELAGSIATAEALEDRDGDFSDPGDLWKVELAGEPRKRMTVGSPFYYGPSPNGVGIVVPKSTGFAGDATSDEDVFQEDIGKGLLIREAKSNGKETTLVNAGGLALARPPRAGDYVFLTPTRTNPAAIAAWSIIPNLQSFWLVDAVTQNHPIPLRYMGYTAAYAGVQIAGLLSLAVLLFQKREVG